MTNEEFIESIKLDNEEWRDVVGYEGYYMVSSLGRIVSLSRIVNTCNNATRKTNQRILKPNVTPRGNILYEYISLCLDNKRVALSIHRMVAMAFIPNPNNYPQVDHINDNPLDNRACNLQWCTQKMNNSKEHHCKAVSQSKKGRPAAIRIPVVGISIADGTEFILPYLKSAEKYGFNYTAISMVLHNKRKTHGGYKWMYLSEYQKLVNQ